VIGRTMRSSPKKIHVLSHGIAVTKGFCARRA
jgi:hypothetical protein